MSVRDAEMLIGDAEATDVADERLAGLTNWRRAVVPGSFLLAGIFIGVATHAASSQKIVAPLSEHVDVGGVQLYNTISVGVVGPSGSCVKAKCGVGSTCCINTQGNGYCCAVGNICKSDVCVVPFGLCFAGDAVVNVFGKGSMALNNVSVGDKVMVRGSDSALSYEPVLDFLHATSPGKLSNYLTVTHSEGHLRVSPNHIVFLVDGSDKLARMLAIGDELATPNGIAKVLRIEESKSESGMFAPLTASGTVVVDGVVASNYATHSETTWIPHAAIHATFFPLRLYRGLGFTASTAKPTLATDVVHPFANFLREHVGSAAMKLFNVK